MPVKGGEVKEDADWFLEAFGNYEALRIRVFATMVMKMSVVSLLANVKTRKLLTSDVQVLRRLPNALLETMKGNESADSAVEKDRIHLNNFVAEQTLVGSQQRPVLYA